MAQQPSLQDSFDSELPFFTEYLLWRARRDNDQEKTETDSYSREVAGSRNLEKSATPKVQHVNENIPVSNASQELLSSWVMDAAEGFHPNVFIVEFIGQTLFCLIGPLAIPILYVLYGFSVTGLQNRAMWIQCKNSAWAFIFVANMMMGIGILTGTFMFIFMESTIEYPVIVQVLVLLILRCITIAIKYAYLPLPAWRQLGAVIVPQKRLLSLLVVLTWSNVKPEIARMYADLSMITVLGPALPQFHLQFLPAPRTCQAAQVASCRQGRATRQVIAEFVLQEADTGKMKLPEGLDLGSDFPVPATGGFMQTDTCVTLDALFNGLITNVLMHENQLLMWRMSPKLVMLFTVAFIFLQPLCRVVTGGNLFGNCNVSMIVFFITLPANFVNSFTSFGFLAVAIRDMWRRLFLMRSCAALLSYHPRDRHGLPRQTRCMGILDMNDPETAESFRLLRCLCMDWGKAFTLRCAAFSGAYAVATGVFIGWTLLVIEAKLNKLLSPTLLMTALIPSVTIGSAIVTLAVLGEGVNTATSRFSYLIQKQKIAIQATTLQGCARDEIEKTSRAREFLDSIVSDIAVEQQEYPMKLLGMKCGVSLLSALYVIPFYVGSRIAKLCSERPDVCMM